MTQLEADIILYRKKTIPYSHPIRHASISPNQACLYLTQSTMPLSHPIRHVSISPNQPCPHLTQPGMPLSHSISHTSISPNQACLYLTQSGMPLSHPIRHGYRVSVSMIPFRFMIPFCKSLAMRGCYQMVVRDVHGCIAETLHDNG